jgi:XTP/dITP diphosphohydrolase
VRHLPPRTDRRLLVATRSRHKLDELRALLHLPDVELVSLDDLAIPDEAEETAKTFRGNAIIKARCYAAIAALPTLADDSGIEVDALGGRPGVWTRRYAGPDATDADNNAKLLRELGDLPPNRRGARYVCVLAYLDPGATRPGDRPWVVTRSGTFRGRVAFELRGEGGFGYDPLFEPLAEPPGGRTVGQMTAEEKNRISHRARASMAMARHLKTLGW